MKNFNRSGELRGSFSVPVQAAPREVPVHDLVQGYLAVQDIMENFQSANSAVQAELRNQRFNSLKRRIDRIAARQEQEEQQG